MDNYYFTLEKAKEINNNPELLEKEALIMKKSFDTQGNQKHSLEGQFNYHNALFMEKVFYEQLVPIFRKYV